MEGGSSCWILGSVFRLNLFTFSNIMEEHEILDHLPAEGDHELSEDLIKTVVACAKVAKVFVIVSLIYEMSKFYQNWQTMNEFQDSIADIYGSYFWYVLQSFIISLTSLITLYFLWQFSKRGNDLRTIETAFLDMLSSLRNYFIAAVVMSVLFRILQFLGPMLSQLFIN